MILKNTRAELDRLLQVRNDHPDRTLEIDATIRDRFSETHAIMVLDMAGFSRLTMRYGIIPFLAALQRLRTIVIPLIETFQGKVVKQDADNVFAIFPDVDPALEAAVNILKQLTDANTKLLNALDLYASIGIGYGEVLIVADEDLFGNEMNLASKLGEDLARTNEILLTEAAFQRVDVKRHSWEKFDIAIGGLELMTYKVQVPMSLDLTAM